MRASGVSSWHTNVVDEEEAIHIQRRRFKIKAIRVNKTMTNTVVVAVVGVDLHRKAMPNKRRRKTMVHHPRITDSPHPKPMDSPPTAGTKHVINQEEGRCRR